MERTWERNAACRGIDSSLFYPAEDESARAAKAICAGCEVSTDCLEFAISNRERDGVWGGATAIERQRLVRRRRRERRLRLVSA